MRLQMPNPPHSILLWLSDDDVMTFFAPDDDADGYVAIRWTAGWEAAVVLRIYGARIVIGEPGSMFYLDDW